jgi:hypothetical protein
MSKCYDNPDYDDTYSDIQNTWNQHPKVEQKHETKVMKNIHVLPTDKPSRLHEYDFLSPMNISKEPLQWRLGRNIYITNDEEIKDYWFLNTLTNEIGFTKDFIGIQKNAKKIILTTDQDLIKDGVQAIDDEFLEWFVKNPSCEEIEVDDIPYKWHKEDGSIVSDSVYKILIPQEIQPQQIWNEEKKEGIKKLIQKQKLIDMMEQDEQLGLYQETKCYCGHTTTCDCVPEEPKQENINALDFEVNALKREIKVLKHQQERSYSEEKVLPLLEMLQKCKEYFLLKTDKYSDERADAIIDVMEQFKKK